MKIVIVVAILGLAGCSMSKEQFRAEVEESRAYISRTCGTDQACRQQMAQSEAYRIDSQIREQEARRERFAAAMRQYSENQARIAAAQAARPTTTHCNRFGNTINCQSY